MDRNAGTVKTPFHYSPRELVRTVKRRLKTAIKGFKPYIPKQTDLARLRKDVGRYFGLNTPEVEKKFEAYEALHNAKNYAGTLGEEKTLCFEEAFVAYVALSLTRPNVILEVGTQYGNSTRRLIDMAAQLELDSRIVCIDIEDQVRHFARNEADLLIADVTGRFRRDVLEKYRPGFVYLDAHPYFLLQEIVREMLDYQENCIMAIHDCSKGLCNPRMTIDKDDPSAITSKTGVWERYVLAEIFGIRNPMSRRLDRLDTATHRLRIFDTPHGIALLRRR